jgi:CubicO group peptidase (beta-lactamase class C family)
MALQVNPNDFFRPSANAASMVAGVVYGDKIIFDCGIEASPEDTMFAVASISKLMVAVVAMQTVEQGKLDLDADIQIYLPSTMAKIRNPCHVDRHISCRMLLQHKSSLADDESALLPGPWRSSDTDCPVTLMQYVTARVTGVGSNDAEDIWLKAHRLWSMYTPGEARYHYSNFGITLMALILECIRGESFAVLAKTCIFDPLHMARSSFTLAEAKAIAATTGAKIAQPHQYGCISHYGVAELPAAGLRASLGDLLRFIMAFTSADACPLLSPASIALMLPASFRGGLAWWGRDADYGEHSEDVWAHGGYMEGVRSHLYYWPQHRAGMVVVLDGEESYLGLKAAMRSSLMAYLREHGADHE